MKTIKKMSKALKLLQTNKSVAERSIKYADRIKTSLMIDMINPLEEKIEKIDDNIFDLENFNLETNLNKGQKLMTKEDCETRFKQIINLKYDKKLLELELKAKRDAYDELFGE